MHSEYFVSDATMLAFVLVGAKLTPPQPATRHAQPATTAAMPRLGFRSRMPSVVRRLP
jgi:hypothetical protein